MCRPLLLRLLALAVSLAAPAGRAMAQDLAVAERGQITNAPVPVTGWASVGLGSGQVGNSSSTSLLSGTLRISLARGPLMVTYRDNDIGPLFSSGEDVRDTGVLIGGRTSGQRAFFSGTIGYAQARSSHQCENCGSSRSTGSNGVLAYDIMAHVNYIIPGLAVSLSGAMGPSNVAYHTVGLNVEMGWFGQ